MNDDLIGRRLEDVKDNINKDFDLLKDFEDEMRLETDSRKMAKYELEIKKQRESLAWYLKEYEELKKEAAPAQMLKVADLLQQKEAKLDVFQELLNQKLLPHVWNVPHSRNPNFTGREDILSELRGALVSGEPAAWKQTLTGLGGVGKTQLAVEYIYRNMADYRVVRWIRSENSAILAADYSGLANDLDLREKDSRDQPEKIGAVKRWLEHSEGWLLIFDNAQNPEDIHNYLPQGGAGHVIITSRNPNWSDVSKLLPIRAFKRPESINFLCKRTGQDDKKTADVLADELGDLPLALEQAGAYIETTGIPMNEYLKLFRERRKDLWKDESPPLDYPQPVGATWSLAMDRIHDVSPEGADFLNLCSFLAPDDIPLELVREGAEYLPLQLAAAVTDRLVMNRAVRLLRQYSLIEASGNSISFHRLVQVVVRDRLSDDEMKTWAESALRILSDAFPYERDDVQTWHLSRRLLPHALAAAVHAENLRIIPEELGYILNQTGLYLQDSAEFAEAKANFEKALSIDKEVYGEKHPNVAIDLNNIGLAWQALGDFKNAIWYLEQALSINKEVYGEKHSAVARNLNNIGLTWYVFGDSEKAISYYERALSIDKEVYGEKHSAVAIDLNNIGMSWHDLGDSEKAILYLEQALSIDKEVYGEKHPKVAIRFGNIGSAWNALGEAKKAISCYEQALSINKEVYGEKHSAVARDLNNIGMSWDTLGEAKKAKGFFQQAYDIFREIHGDEYPHTRTIKERLDAIK